MTFIYILIIGTVSGWLVGLIMRGGGYGLLGNIIIGIVGSFIGGWLLGVLNISLNIGSATINTIIQSVIGSVTLMIAVNFLLPRTYNIISPSKFTPINSDTSHKRFEKPNEASNKTQTRQLGSLEPVIKKPNRVKKIFISYSQNDRHYLEELLKHLAGLRRQGKIEVWDDGKILPGKNWDDEIKRELADADIILLLLSADFLSTDYVWNVEITKAMDRHEHNKTLVVPIFVRPCNWNGFSFSRLNGLPYKGKSVSSYENRDEAWLEIVSGIEKLI